MLRPIFAPLAALYGLAIGIRHKLFDWKILRSEESGIPVVCVGNLTVGGTGKTPVTELLVGYLSRDYRVAVLSRGYGRKTKGFRVVEADSPVRAVGDEPKQIKLRFPDILVAVCEKRAEGIRRIRERFPEVNLIILDDGFQHRYVEPWVNVLLMDYNNPVYRDKLLPWGRLRDSVSQLYRAHFVVVTKCPAVINPLEMRIVNKSLSLYPYQSLFFTHMKAGPVRPLFADVAVSPAIGPDTPVIAMSGIASPDSFVGSLEERYKVVGRLSFGDHHTYRMRDLRTIARALDEAPEGAVVVMTEKDAVKLTNRRRIPAGIQSRLYVQPIRVEFIGSAEEEFLRKLNCNVKSNPKYSVLHPQ